MKCAVLKLNEGKPGALGLCKTLPRNYNVNSSKDWKHTGFSICKNVLFFALILLIVAFLTVVCHFSI